MKLTSKLVTGSDAAKANRAAHEEALRVVQEAAEAAAAGGGAKSRERHVARGKMLPRERVSPGQWGWVRLDWSAPNGVIAAVPAAFNLVPGHFTPDPHLVGDYLYVASLNDQVLQVGTFHDPLEQGPHGDDEPRPPLAVDAGETHLSLPERFTTAAALATARVDLYQLGPVGYDAPITVARMRSAAGRTGAGRPWSAMRRRTAAARSTAKSPNARVSSS